MIKHCLFPVAGFGTRFLPVTKTVPKELLPILDKPLIQYAIDEAYGSGISEMVMVINKYKLAIKKYFEPFPYLESLISSSPKINQLMCIDNITKNCTLNFINQTEMLGLGHAILQGKNIIGDNPFAVVLPDDLCHNEDESVINQMQEIYKENKDKCIVAVEEVDIKDVNKYGVISFNSSLENTTIFYVNDMIEKHQMMLIAGLRSNQLIETQIGPDLLSLDDYQQRVISINDTYVRTKLNFTDY